tara:strand:- start:94 stop:711 length:618 start_codon:yes stop_codon:yes gene_type:complete
MKEQKFKELVAYAESFVSFVLPKVDVKEIVLFGSVARGEFGKESDVDIFFDVEKSKESTVKKIIKSELQKFKKSKVNEIWELKGIGKEIKCEVGELEKWKLRRSVVSDGIVLYGKYKEVPKNLKAYVFFYIKPVKNIAKRNKLIREIFGRKEKNYSKQGVFEDVEGREFSKSSFIVPKEKEKLVRDILNKNKIDYQFIEIWSDGV